MGSFSGYTYHNDSRNGYILAQLEGEKPGSQVEIIGSPHSEKELSGLLETLDYTSLKDLSHGRDDAAISPGNQT